MPTRILRDTYATSDTIASLPIGPQDRFPRYTLGADDFGCFRVDPLVIKGLLFIKRPDVTPETIAADLESFRRAGLLLTWTVGNKTFAYFRGWFDSQNRPRGMSKRKTPPPPDNVANFHVSENPNAFAISANHLSGLQDGRTQSQSQSQSQSHREAAPSAPNGGRESGSVTESAVVTVLATGSSPDEKVPTEASGTDPASGTEPRSPARGGGPVYDCVAFWRERWREAKGEPAVTTDADFGQVKRLLKVLTAEQVRERMRRALADPWFLERGFDLKVFSSKVDRWAPKKQAEPELRELKGYDRDGNAIWRTDAR